MSLWRSRNATVDIENGTVEPESKSRPRTVHEHRKATEPSYNKPRITEPNWFEAVDTLADRARAEAIKEAENRKEEKEAERKLAIRLIDIGFKILSQELHPDKGGSRDAMARLNRVRERLKQCV